MSGWICLHRDILEKPIWTTSTTEQKVVLMTLLLMANHEEKEWEFKGEKYKVKPGQFITSIGSIVEKCGKNVTTQNVRTALKRFEKYEFLTIESTSKNSLITLVNWEVYQGYEPIANKPSNKRLTNDQQTPNKRLTTNNNDKQLNNVTNINNSLQNYSSHKLKFDEDDLKLVDFFVSEIKKNFPDFKEQSKNSWANTFRLMVERDNRDRREICEVIRFSQEDDFWHKNILSASKLRKQFDTLKAQMQGGRKSVRQKSLERNVVDKELGF